MSDSSDEMPAEEVTIDEIADSFIARLERGEHPSIVEYKENYPHLADQFSLVLRH